MTSVTFPPHLGGSGITISDDADPITGLLNGGHERLFVPGLQGVVDMASYVYQYAQAIDGAKGNADRAEDARGIVEAVAAAVKGNIHEQFLDRASLSLDFARQSYLRDDGARVVSSSINNVARFLRNSPKWDQGPSGGIRQIAVSEPGRVWEQGQCIGANFEKAMTNFAFAEISALPANPIDTSDVFVDSVKWQMLQGATDYATASGSRNNARIRYQDRTYEAGSYTVSIQLKGVGQGATSVGMRVFGDDTVTSVASIRPGQVVRLTVTFEMATSWTAVAIRIIASGGDTRVKIAGPQLVAGVSRGSQILTTEMAVTRPGDLLDAGINGLVALDSGFTVSWRGRVDRTLANLNYLLFLSNSRDQTGDNWIGIAMGSVADTGTATLRFRNSSDGSLGERNIVVVNEFAISFAVDYQASVYSMCVNGEVVVDREPMTCEPLNDAYLKLGTSNGFNSTPRQVCVIPEVLTVSEMQELTA